MGLNEVRYRQHCDTYVTKTIARYSAKRKTNLRKDAACLPNYIDMDDEERMAKLQGVEALLGRLDGKVGVA